MPDRPLIGAQGPVVASATQRVDWLVDQQHVEAVVDTPAELREWIAAQWLADAQAEHASAASYARAALELMALGAPPELVAGCHRAAEDEVRHAQQCFTLASRYAGSPVGPAPLRAPATRADSLTAAAVAVFCEGCVGETVAALLLTRSARQCAFESVKQVLLALSEDEAAHASLGWETLAWALETGGVAVAEALRQRMEQERSRLLDPATVRADPNQAALARHGRLTASVEAGLAEDAWQSLITPQLDRLLADY